jgi:hypothetical protein
MTCGRSAFQRKTDRGNSMRMVATDDVCTAAHAVGIEYNETDIHYKRTKFKRLHNAKLAHTLLS